MARPRKIKSAAEMAKLWADFKADCDNRNVLAHEFSQKTCGFISKEIKRATTYTIEGFCVFIDLSRQAFHEYYSSDKRFVDTVTRMREECEIDARRKFETGQIPSQLAALWMGNYGYGANINNRNEVSGHITVAQDPYSELTVEELRNLAKLADEPEPQ